MLRRILWLWVVGLCATDWAGYYQDVAREEIVPTQDISIRQGVVPLGLLQKAEALRQVASAVTSPCGALPETDPPALVRGLAPSERSRVPASEGRLYELMSLQR
jgi:hypothetical protein